MGRFVEGLIDRKLQEQKMVNFVFGEANMISIVIELSDIFNWHLSFGFRK